MLILTYVILLSLYFLYRTDFIELGEWSLLEDSPSDEVQKFS